MSVDAARVLRFERRAEAAHWNELTPREKQVLFLLVVHNKTLKEASCEMGISVSRAAMLSQTACRLLRVSVIGGGESSLRRVAFWMGRNWEEISAEAEK